MKRLIFVIFTTAAYGAEHWSEIRLAGQPTGYLHSTLEKLEGGKARTTEEMVFAMNRLGSRVEIRSTSHTVEDARGAMISVISETTSSQQTVSMSGVRKGDEIELRTKAGDKSYTQMLPAGGTILGPEGAAALARETLKHAGDRMSFQMFVAEIGKVATFTRTVLAIEAVNEVTALKVREDSDIMPDHPLSWYDAEGALVRSERQMPFGTMVTVASTREAALAAAKGSELGEESYTRTLARSNVRLPDPRSIDRMVVRLTHKRPELGWPAFEGPHQRVVETTPTSVTLEIVRPTIEASAQDSGGEPYLLPNAILQSDDGEVAALAQKIVGGERDRYRAARKLQEWVSQNVSLDLGIALAPASEVVRNRRGTCIAFSVLLASLERAAGIPSRVAEGFVYIDGIWGGHAWTEILAGGQWVPLDSALYRSGPADAARFQFGSYTLEDNLAAANQAGMQMYGNIEVAVLEYTIHGRTVQVPAGASPYTADGAQYRNLWLGISVAKPQGFRFTTLDAVYPDATIVRMENGSAHVVVTQEPAGVDPDAAARRNLEEVAPAASARRMKLDGRVATAVNGASKARLVERDGDTLWVITAEGQDAARLLDQIAGGWKWIRPE